MNATESNTERFAIPVGGSISLECESDFPAMWSQHKDGKMKNLANGRLLLPEISKQRYFSSVKGKKYILILKNALSEDSSEILCNNKNHFYIQVVPDPVCSKLNGGISEDEQVAIECELNVQSHETDKPRLSWKLGNDKVFEVLDKKRGTFSYTAKYLDHDKPLKCVVHPDHWNPNIPKPSCSYGKLEIRFIPRIQCQSQIFIPGGQSETAISCTIIANPLPPLNSALWELLATDSSKRQKLRSENSVENGQIISTIELNRDRISRQRPSLELELSVKNPLYDAKEIGGTSNPETLIKKLRVEMILGPEIACPSRKRLKKEDAKFSCDVYVNPIPPTGNISWHYEDAAGGRGGGAGGNVFRQGKEMVFKIQGGIRVEFPAKTMRNDFDQNNQQSGMKMILRVSGPSQIATKDIYLFWGSDFGDFYDDEGYDGNNNNYKNAPFHFSGVAVLISFLLSLIMLTATVCVALFKKGYLCLREEKMVYEKEIPVIALEEVSGKEEREREREREKERE